MESKEIDIMKDVKDAVDKINKLQEQINHPTRNEMIKALIDAKSTAPVEVTVTEFIQGDTQFMMWDDFSDADLYRKLTQYQEGLKVFCISKVGEYTFNQIMNNKKDISHDF